ncbi:hypothetical protein JOF48_000996 [Arthrobacter stackebrandtii]|uniref:VOC domain-containing protein n=1 Tax=Arthrobacter stackebrandtii TaxID=272161 RepID=A0ABS4YUV7_9MICC|nr:VOC family protein [Arthrobacter stackebrandtii]MBP2412197.1 hypothetical protein [Arthrobacter stackebrandtii]PYH01986.1 hypothetical protein CVV67_00640 [Arthrobacter stackebrandtii]
MLRVRPVHFTSDLDGYAAQLEDQGLKCVENHGDWRVFDSGNGKVGIHQADAGSPMDGATELGFEVRDHEIFVRRTLEDGTQAEVVDSRHGGTARVTAPGGFNFLADPVTDLSLPTGGPLAVTAVWHTPDTAAAEKVLADIGAKFVQHRADGGSLFRAKNGGFVATIKGGSNAVELEISRDLDGGGSEQ